EADMHWDRRLCIHVGECGRSDDELFVAKRDPWCKPDLVPIGKVTEVAERCPTGSLSYIRKDGGAPEAPAEVNRVVVSNNGPLYVTGDLDVAAAEEDQPGLSFRAALCRCGLSKNKPFCDNRHEAGFKDHGAVGTSGPGLETEGGTLSVGSFPNGPLHLKGNLRIVSSSGRVAWSGTEAFLCRCGQSKNKPFCDGAHKAAGFEAP
ncbi:MAG: CDGSH iron-sulfur domain-containing protein, partial [Deltaproteobacteria bacterium]|nr:CDGSH iron-sulfur domain-containing protein [Deltaproteobacteria bacterium]